MVYLDKFVLPQESQLGTEISRIKNKHSRDEWFPIGFFPKKKLEQIDFDPVTIFYGGNGSGKSTLLSLIAESLHLRRHAESSLTGAFFDYCDLCTVDNKKIPTGSRILTSEDVFQNIFSTRTSNNSISAHKSKLEEDFEYSSNDFMYDGFENSQLVSKKLVKRAHIEKNTSIKQRQYSNGENALMFFKEAITKNALYLLDEPENSMSPKFQLELRDYLEDCAKYAKCQLIIATHSPFVLSITGAKIYNLDETPVNVQKWYDLKNIRLLYNFFEKNRSLFEIDSMGAKKKTQPKK